MGIINREKEEEFIIGCENLLDGLMPDEKMLIINELIDRMKKGQEKQRMSDLMENSVSGSLLQRVQKKFFKAEEEKE